MKIKKLLRLITACVLGFSMAGGVFVNAEDSEDSIVTDVKIEFDVPAQANMRTCVGDVVWGSYIYTAVGDEEATEYRWIYSDTEDFADYNILHEGITTAGTVKEDTAFTIGSKLSGKYIVFEVTPADSDTALKSEPMLIATKNIAASDYAMVTSQNQTADVTVTGTNFLSVRNNSSAIRITFFKFDLKDCEEVESARLLFTTHDVYDRKTMIVFPSGNGWDKSITWNTFDWSQIGGAYEGDVSALNDSTEITRITDLSKGVNGNELDLTSYINSELEKGNTQISVALFAQKNDAGIAFRAPGRPNDAPYLVVCAKTPVVSVSDVKITDVSGNEISGSMKGQTVCGQYSFISDNGEGATEFRWLYAKREDSDTWFTYKFGTTDQANVLNDTKLEADNILAGSYLKLQITPKTSDGEIGKSVSSQAIRIKSGKLTPLAVACVRENDPSTSMGITSNSFHVRMDAQGNRRATLMRYSLEGLSYPVENAEFSFYMYYSSTKGEYVFYDIEGGWQDGETLNSYGSIETILNGTEIGRAAHSGTNNQNIDPPEKVSVDFTEYINNALKEGKTEIDFAIWYAAQGSNIVSYIRGPLHDRYPAEITVTQRTTNINREVRFYNGTKIDKLETGNIEIRAASDSSDNIIMLAVLFDADGNMLESRVDAGTAEFYAQIDNTSGDGEYIEVYFWNNFSELKEQAYILKLTPEGIFEE